MNRLITFLAYALWYALQFAFIIGFIGVLIFAFFNLIMGK